MYLNSNWEHIQKEQDEQIHSVVDILDLLLNLI